VAPADQRDVRGHDLVAFDFAEPGKLEVLCDEDRLLLRWV